MNAVMAAQPQDMPSGYFPPCGVVVTYNPGPEVPENLAAMVRECARVFVVDNGSPSASQAALAAVPGVELVPLGENVGLAAALNRGVDRAVGAGFEWAVTFDQDSRPEVNFLQALWARHLELPAAAVIGPMIVEPGVGSSSYRWVRRHPRWRWRFQRARDEVALADVTMVVTSGSLLDLAFWRRLERFDEGLFIDYVDIDYCLRVLEAGRRVAVAPRAVLRHRLGARQSVRAWGREWRPMHHAAFRHYYMARNRVILWRRHAWREPHWAAFDLSFALYNYTRVLLFEDQRWAKCRAVMRGTLHGLLGRTGSMP
jgi:rhamnosyltransferase